MIMKTQKINPIGEDSHLVKAGKVIAKQKEEIKELRAHVGYFDKLLDELWEMGRGPLTQKEYRDLGQNMRNLIFSEGKRTPRQSLTHIQADAVIEYGKNIVGWVNGHPIPRPEKYAGQLCEQAEGEG